MSIADKDVADVIRVADTTGLPRKVARLKPPGMAAPGIHNLRKSGLTQACVTRRHKTLFRPLQYCRPAQSDGQAAA